MSLESQPEIILATTSSSRPEIFTKMGIPFTFYQLDSKEELTSPTKPIQQFTKEISLSNAQDLSHLKNKVIISLETCVVLDQHIFSKPKNSEEAYKMLQQISSQTIQVVTGVAVIDTLKSRTISQTDTTFVSLSRISSSEIEWFVSTNQWRGVSGGLTLDGFGSRFVKSVQGNYNNTLGVPSRLIYEQLINLGYEDILMPPKPELEKTKTQTGAHLPFL